MAWPLAVIESDQQIGNQGGDLPENEYQQQVVGHDNAQHGEHKEVKIGEEAAGVGVSGHITGCEEGHQNAGSGDNQAEHKAQPVESKSQPDFETGHPGPLDGKNAPPRSGAKRYTVRQTIGGGEPWRPPRSDCSQRSGLMNMQGYDYPLLREK